MPAYMIANIDVHDEARFAEYRELVAPVLASFGGRYLVRAGAVHPLEGEFALKRVVLIEFATLEAAQTFYHSPEYGPLLQLRLASTASQLVIVEGVS